MAGLVLTTGLLAQSTFAYRYSDGDINNDQIVYSLAPTSDGGFILVGPSKGGLLDVGVVKLNSSGVVSWAKHLNTSDVEYGAAVIQSTDGGYVVAGCSVTDNMLLLKFNSSGDLTGYYSYGTSWDGAKSVIQDGSYIVMAGKRINPSDLYFDDWFVVKVRSSDGGVSWGRLLTCSGYSGGVHDSACSIIRTSDGGYLIAGTLADQMTLVKITSTPDFSWAKRYSYASSSFACYMIGTSDGGALMVGYARPSGGTNDILVLKIASGGDLTWARRYDSGADEGPGLSAVQAPDGGYVISASRGGAPLIFRISSDGNTVRWSSRITMGSAFGGWANGTLARSADGGYVFGGSLSGDYMLIKLDSLGQHPNCVQACPLTVSTPTINVSSLTFTLSSAGPARNSYTNPPSSLTLDTVRLTCSSLYDKTEEEADGTKRAVSCSWFPWGLRFDADERMDLRIYFPDGRLACSREIGGGATTIPLEAGVYLWQAGPYWGKAVVR